MNELINKITPIYIIIAPFMFLYFSTGSYLAKLEIDTLFIHKLSFRFYAISSICLVLFVVSNKQYNCIPKPCIKQPIEGKIFK